VGNVFLVQRQTAKWWASGRIDQKVKYRAARLPTHLAVLMNLCGGGQKYFEKGKKLIFLNLMFIIGKELRFFHLFN
jgi:hypothetical protein